MSLTDFSDWISENEQKSPYWIAKRLSSNDTGLTGGHQGGPLIPKVALYRLFPGLAETAPSVTEDYFDLHIDSHQERLRARAVWYKSKNEGRFTNLRGKKSPFLNPDNTGALAVFAFRFGTNGDVSECHSWLCKDPSQEDLLEAFLGGVEPKEFVIRQNDALPPHSVLRKDRGPLPCRLPLADIPKEWLTKFPSGEEIILKVLSLRPGKREAPDVRLLERRRCEYEVFQSIEEATFLPRVTPGFNSIENFTSLAQTILQSRKSRSGKSLELHAREILQEEGFRKDRDFTHQPKIDGAPDFIFPSEKAYKNSEFPTSQLRVLAAKTTCKDRWRQVTKEAKRIDKKHLLTLQEGVTEAQFEEMQDAGVCLVVPVGLHKSYPEKIRPMLIGFEKFIRDLKKLNPLT